MILDDWDVSIGFNVPIHEFVERLENIGLNPFKPRIVNVRNGKTAIHEILDLPLGEWVAIRVHEDWNTQLGTTLCYDAYYVIHLNKDRNRVVSFGPTEYYDFFVDVDFSQPVDIESVLKVMAI